MTDAARKAQWVRALQGRLLNPVMRPLIGWGLVPGCALLETTGRRSGQPRQVPVSDGLHGDTFWIVAEHGRRADWVRNVEADPAVRLRVGRRWYTGTAHLLPDDDPTRRLGREIRGLNAASVRAAGSDLLTVRIDLAGPS